MNHIGTIIIETERLILRPFIQEDAESIYKNWASDPEVTKYLMWPTHENVETSKEILKEWVENYEKKDYYHWAIVPKDNTNQPVGCIGVMNQIDETIKMAHIGYCIGREWWHKGVTSEALNGVIDFLFTKIGVNRIESRHDPHNPNSGEVMKKCGMKYEGTLRQSDWNNQGICDASYYAILREE